MGPIAAVTGAVLNRALGVLSEPLAEVTPMSTVKAYAAPRKEALGWQLRRAVLHALTADGAHGRLPLTTLWVAAWNELFARQISRNHG